MRRSLKTLSPCWGRTLKMGMPRGGAFPPAPPPAPLEGPALGWQALPLALGRRGRQLQRRLGVMQGVKMMIFSWATAKR